MHLSDVADCNPNKKIKPAVKRSSQRKEAYIGRVRMTECVVNAYFPFSHDELAFNFVDNAVDYSPRQYSSQECSAVHSQDIVIVPCTTLLKPTNLKRKLFEDMRGMPEGDINL